MSGLALCRHVFEPHRSALRVSPNAGSEATICALDLTSSDVAVSAHLGRYALPEDERVPEGPTHPVCASQNLTFEAPALPPIGCLAQRVKQRRDLRSDPLPDEGCRIDERKHGISIAPVVRIRTGSAVLAPPLVQLESGGGSNNASSAASGAWKMRSHSSKSARPIG